MSVFTNRHSALNSLSIANEAGITANVLLNQRRVDYTGTQKRSAESKGAMRNRGVSSPDRTDAVFGAMICQNSGAITLETLKGIWFGGPGPRLFPAEPVTFEDPPDEYV